MSKISLFQQHKETYSHGCGSAYCGAATKIVLCRGKIPCDVLFCGEAPGESEDTLGVPFVGPAGKLLDQIIIAAKLHEKRLAFTNLVGCFPKTEEGEDKFEPDKKAIDCCHGRLGNLIQIASPKVIVWVGGVAKKHGPKTIGTTEIKQFSIIHPAALLRAMFAQRDILIQQAILILDSIHEEF